MTVEAITSRTFGFMRLRYQLGGGIILTGLLYTAMLAAEPYGPVNVELLTRSTLYCVGATMIGVALLRSVSQYPGVQAHAYILPAFAFSYGGLLAVLLLARLPYSRLLVFGSFFIVTSWFAILLGLSSRRQSLRIGVVPGGDHRSLKGIDSIEWVELTDDKYRPDGVQAIAADLNFDHNPEWDRRLADYALAGIPVYHIKQLEESLLGRVELEHLSENRFGTLSPVSAYLTIKHVVDWLVALFAAAALAPVMLGFAIAIRVDSPGPAIFKQIRIGYRGRPFTVYKFRTMKHAAKSTADRTAAKTLSADDRITSLGAFLRRTRIDELPQIYNILRAEMSWIGPRPEAQVLSEWYEGEIPFYRYRHIVRPGVTGWAQVNQGHVAEVEDVREKLYYDFYYIKNFSPWIDMLIVAKTLRTVLTGFGAK